jgi:hypothetical protein
VPCGMLIAERMDKGTTTDSLEGSLHPNLLSVRKKSLTSAWGRSTSSTGRTSGHPANNMHSEVAEAAAAAAVAVAFRGGLAASFARRAYPSVETDLTGGGALVFQHRAEGANRAVADLAVAGATYRAACRRRPNDKVTLWQGTRRVALR